MNKMLLTFQNVAYLLKMKITTWKQKTKYLQQHQIWQATSYVQKFDQREKNETPERCLSNT